MTEQSTWPSALSRLAASLALLACASGAWAFPTNVGLFVAGGAGGGMNSGGASARSGGATPYFIEAYNQASYPTLTGHSQGEWAFTGLLSGPESGATSDASANFGSLGVRSWAWAYDAPHSVYNDRYIFQFGASASATASFFDSWYISAPGQLAGATGSLDVTIGLSGSRDYSRYIDYTNLNLQLTNYTAGQSRSVDDASPGTYVLSIPVVLGQWNNIQLNLLAEASSAWLADSWSVISPGGEQSVDFLHTASVDGITLRDGNGAAISDFSLSALSGHDYLPATPPPPAGIPEPGALALVCTALGGLALRRRKAA